jgi:hypothetical protein
MPMKTLLTARKRTGRLTGYDPRTHKTRNCPGAHIRSDAQCGQRQVQTNTHKSKDCQALTAHSNPRTYKTRNCPGTHIHSDAQCGQRQVQTNTHKSKVHQSTRTRMQHMANLNPAGKPEDMKNSTTHRISLGGHPMKPNNTLTSTRLRRTGVPIFPCTPDEGCDESVERIRTRAKF